MTRVKGSCCDHSALLNDRQRCLQASTHAKTIIGISVSATREAELRVQYEDTRTRALALDLPLSHGARDAWALGDTEDLAAGLDACLATLAAVLASQYAPLLKVA